MPNILESYFSIKREQKPIHQFLDLKNSIFLVKNQSKKNLFLLSLFFFLSFLLAIHFSFGKEFLLLVICFLCFSWISFFLWQNILKSFREEKIYYEESSWFDTKAWSKPIFFLRNDRIFANQNIKENQKTSLQYCLIQGFFLLLVYFLH